MPEYQRRVLMQKQPDGSYKEISVDFPLEVHDPKVGSLISYEGTTTADGAPDGSTLVCSGLEEKPDYDGNLVIITSGAYAGQARDITGDTTVGTVTPHIAFGGKIVSGVTFVIVGIRTTPAEVAAIEALLTNADYGLAALHGDIGDKGAGVDIITRLGAFTAAENLKAILGDLSTTKRLGQILGGLDETDTLKAILGAFTATENLKAILGAFTTAANLKAAIDAIKGAGWTDENLTTIDSLIDAIKAVTDALPDAGALNDLATILGLVDTAEAAGNYSYTDAGGEQDVYEDTATTRRKIALCVSNRNMTQAGKFRIYRKVDGTNYDLYITQAATVGAGDDRAFDAEFTTSLPWKITYEEDVDETAARNIPYEVITEVKE